MLDGTYNRTLWGSQIRTSSWSCWTLAQWCDPKTQCCILITPIRFFHSKLEIFMWKFPFSSIKKPQTPRNLLYTSCTRQKTQYKTKEHPPKAFCILPIKKYICISSSFLCSYLFSLVLPNVFKGTFCHGVWPKSQQDNHNCSTPTVMGQARSKGAIRWEEMTQVCQELARQHYQKAGGKAALPPKQKVWAEAVTPLNSSNRGGCSYFMLQNPASCSRPAHRGNTLIMCIYISPGMTW